MLVGVSRLGGSSTDSVRGTWPILSTSLVRSGRAAGWLRAIIAARRKNTLKTAEEIAAVIRQSIRGPRQKIDPATRTFQALRIAVNEELKSLEVALRRLPSCMQAGARLAIISFHSLEDRRVKDAFRENAAFETITRKPIRPSEMECQRNPRSRSARLRIAEIVA